MSYEINKERVIEFIVEGQKLCSREYALWWFEHERIPAFYNETPHHIVKTGQVRSLIEYIQAATLNDEIKLINRGEDEAGLPCRSFW